MRLDGELIPVLDLPGLLKTKRSVQPEDQADAQVLRLAIERIDARD